jgi:two pore calcium channel protein, plant
MQEGYEQFSSYLDSVWSLLILLTTANYPDVMMAAYAQYRVSCIFFIIYLIVGLFFLLNLLLAVFCNSYNGQIESIAQNIIEDNAKYLREGLPYIDQQGKKLKVSHCALLIQEMAAQG